MSLTSGGPFRWPAARVSVPTTARRPRSDRSPVRCALAGEDHADAERRDLGLGRVSVPQSRTSWGEPVRRPPVALKLRPGPARAQAGPPAVAARLVGLVPPAAHGYVRGRRGRLGLAAPETAPSGPGRHGVDLDRLHTAQRKCAHVPPRIRRPGKSVPVALENLGENQRRLAGGTVAASLAPGGRCWLGSPRRPEGRRRGEVVDAVRPSLGLHRGRPLPRGRLGCPPCGERLLAQGARTSS